MNKHPARNFHVKRIAFIMMPDGNLLTAPKGSELSHEQMLMNLGLSVDDIHRMMVKIPRGYFMNSELCIYQGTDMTFGTIWRVQPENYDIIRSYLPKLRQKLSVNDNTNLYLGVRVGNIGDVWEKLYKTTVGAFMR